MWSRRRALVFIRAAAFCTDCRRLISGRPCSRPMVLQYSIVQSAGYKRLDECLSCLYRQWPCEWTKLLQLVVLVLFLILQCIIVLTFLVNKFSLSLSLSLAVPLTELRSSRIWAMTTPASRRTMTQRSIWTGLLCRNLTTFSRVLQQSAHQQSNIIIIIIIITVITTFLEHRYMGTTN